MNEEIRKMVEDGFATKRIANKLGLAFKDVQNITKINNHSIKRELFNINLINHIMQLYQGGVSAKNLGIKYSIDKRRVQKWAKERGYLRNRNESHRFTFFNELYFDEIDTPSKAYWLGFLYADAYNNQVTNTISVTLADKDRAHLDKLAKALNLSKSKITTYNSVLSGKEYPTCCLRLYSKHMCNMLASIGCPQAKSFIIKYPDWLYEELNHHFIRGLFDGDGCLTFRKKQKEWKWSLVSTEECCKRIQQIILSKLGLIKYHCISKENKNTYELETGGNEKIHKLMKWLYEDSVSNIRLDRKFNKFEELVTQQSNRNIKRDNYLLTDESKHKIAKDSRSTKDIAHEHNIHPKTVLEIKQNTNSYSRIVEVDGKPLTAKFFKLLSKEEREQYTEPLFNHFRQQGWLYPEISEQELKKEWKKLCDYVPNLNSNEVFNNSSLATKICKHFCKSFCHATERGKRNMIELWHNDEFLYKLIRNRLVINWNSKVNETFNINYRMMIQGIRSMRAVSAITMFKPAIAKYICMKYSKSGDVVGDYSAGFGGRMLGAASCERKYIGTDPLTIPELVQMKDFMNLKECTLIHSGSENYVGQENSVDLYWSSPPYYDQEYYSDNKTQAYNMGKNFFYNTYWENTLQNVKFMLKPNKWFGLNVKNNIKMLEMAQDYFGDIKEKVGLRTVRSHLNKSAGIEKYEYIYMFTNKK